MGLAPLALALSVLLHQPALLRTIVPAALVLLLQPVVLVHLALVLSVVAKLCKCKLLRSIDSNGAEGRYSHKKIQ